MTKAPAEERERALLGLIPDLLFRIDAGGVFIDYQAADEGDLALPPEAFLGKKASDVLPAPLAQTLARATLDARASGRPQRFQYELGTPRGGVNFYEARLVVLSDGTVQLLIRNLTEQRETERRLHRKSELLEALRVIHTLPLSGGDFQKAFDRLLDTLLRVTDSAVGFIGELLHRDGKRVLRVHTSSPHDQEARDFRDRHAPPRMEFTNLDNLFGAVITTGQVVLCNDVASDPRARGVAPGHTPLQTFLGVPFHHDGDLVGMIGVANKAGGYEAGLTHELEPLLHSCAHLLVTARHERARREADEARLAAQQVADRFRRLFDTSNVFVAVISLEGFFVDVNPAFAVALGWHPDELLGQNAMAFIHPEDLSRAGAAFAQVAQGGEIRNLEMRHRAKDGSYLWLSANGKRDPDHDFFYAVSVDITEQKYQTQQAEERLHLLGMAETMNGLGYWSIDLPSNELKWSYEVFRIHGLDPQTYRPNLTTAIDHYHPEDRASVQTLVEQAIREGKSFQFEHRVLHTSGSVRWVISRGQPRFDGQGQVVGVFGVFQDNTDRRDAQIELHKLAMVANRTSNAVAITDRDGLVDWVNEGFERLTGYPLHEAMGHQPFALLAGPETDPAATESISKRLQGGLGSKVELLTYHRSGRKHWVDLEVQPVFDDLGKICNYIAIGNDVTDRKTSEQQLVAARETALAASRVKSQFLANMSHEIRTPLNGILGAVELLGDSKISPEQAEYVEAIRTSGRTLLATLNDVLDISKIEAGKIELEAVPFSLPAAIEETTRSFLPLARRKGLDLTWTVAPELPTRVLGDPVRFRQIINNLLGNAIKFTAVGAVKVHLARGDDGLLLGSVSDSGPGIPPSRQLAIFEPFTQVDGSTTRRFGGSGLGLAICRELIGRMGGRIWFECPPTGGTIFFFSIPLPEATLDRYPSSNPRIAVAPRRSRAQRILIAEDNPINAMIIRKILEQDGHTLTLVTDGKAALQALRTERYDVVLMDVQMPEMDGLEATRRFRASERERGTPRTPIVTLTANAMKGDEETCLEAGADAYLPKPVDKAALRALLARLIIA